MRTPFLHNSEPANQSLEQICRALGGEYDRVAANFCR